VTPRVGGVVADLGVLSAVDAGHDVDARGLVEKRRDPSGLLVELDPHVIVLDHRLGHRERAGCRRFGVRTG
jgi:hypothetical protein